MGLVCGTLRCLADIGMEFNSPQVHEAGGFDVTNLVDPSDIEIIVGAKRDETFHIGWFNSPGGIFYILHTHNSVSHLNPILGIASTANP